MLAQKGTCHLGGKPGPVEDPELREALVQRGRSIARRSFWIACILTGLTIAIALIL